MRCFLPQKPPWKCHRATLGRLGLGQAEGPGGTRWDVGARLGKGRCQAWPPTPPTPGPFPPAHSSWPCSCLLSLSLIPTSGPLHMAFPWPVAPSHFSPHSRGQEIIPSGRPSPREPTWGPALLLGTVLTELSGHLCTCGFAFVTSLQGLMVREGPWFPPCCVPAPGTHWECRACLLTVDLGPPA